MLYVRDDIALWRGAGKAVTESDRTMSQSTMIQSKRQSEGGLKGVLSTRAYPPPPSDFNPNTAPEAVLLRHGLPRRPDPELEPDLARLWKRVFDRPLTY